MCKKSGFTLLELSIALVIIGLLVGGVIGGRHLIRATHLNTIVQGTTKLDNAVDMFYQKYQQIPGDMYRATNYWSGVSNGNGNFQISLWGGTAPGAIGEDLQIWVHLAKAGLIEGEYVGAVLDPHWFEAGVNFYEIAPEVAVDVWRYTLSGDANHWYLIGALYENAGRFYHGHNTTNSKSPTAEEIWQFDMKFDDGTYNTGKIISPNIGGSCNYNSATVLNAGRRCIIGWAPSWAAVMN